jgi:hypothetical protein
LNWGSICDIASGTICVGKPGTTTALLPLVLMDVFGVVATTDAGLEIVSGAALPLLVPAILEATSFATFFLAPESLEPALPLAALDKLSLAIEKSPCVQ